jgi:hypothetical protein
VIKGLAIAALCWVAAAVAAGVKPSSLVPAQSAEVFRLPTQLTYIERRGLGARIEQGLREGTYSARYQDEKGTYFVGPKQAVCQGSPPCTAFRIEGGVWVSKQNPGDIRIFLIQGLSEPISDSIAKFGLAGFLAKVDLGKYFLFPENKQFAEQLAITKISEPDTNSSP